MPLTSHQIDLILQALQERLRLIADHPFRDRDPQGHLEALKNISLKIDHYYQEWRPEIPGDLRHYLSNASYQKALKWLEQHHPASSPSEN